MWSGPDVVINDETERRGAPVFPARRLTSSGKELRLCGITNILSDNRAARYQFCEFSSFYNFQCHYQPQSNPLANRHQSLCVYESGDQVGIYVLGCHMVNGKYTRIAIVL